MNNNHPNFESGALDSTLVAKGMSKAHTLEVIPEKNMNTLLRKSRLDVHLLSSLPPHFVFPVISPQTIPSTFEVINSIAHPWYNVAQLGRSTNGERAHDHGANAVHSFALPFHPPPLFEL